MLSRRAVWLLWHANRRGQQPERLVVLESGDYFGEAALREAAPRNSTITALTAVDVLTIGRGVFQTLLVTFPAVRPVFEDRARASRMDGRGVERCHDVVKM